MRGRSGTCAGTSGNASRIALDRIYTLILRIEETLDTISQSDDMVNAPPYWDQFCKAMNDDFNTAGGIAVIFNAVRHANRLLDETDVAQVPPKAGVDLAGMRQAILRMLSILGIGNQDPGGYFKAQRHLGGSSDSIDTSVIEKLIADREDARKAKNWAKADQIRAKLSDMNVVLEDRPDGTYWKLES